jgi:hypothetical protein
VSRDEEFFSSSAAAPRQALVLDIFNKGRVVFQMMTIAISSKLTPENNSDATSLRPERPVSKILSAIDATTAIVVHVPVRGGARRLLFR